MRCYSDFDRWLGHGKTKRSRITRKFNYRIRIRKHDNGDIGVELYSTTVLTFHPDGSITLDYGTWPSASTANTMNWFLPYPVGVFIVNRIWGIRLESGPSWMDNAVFHNPVTVSYSHSEGDALRSIWKMDKPYENFGEKYKEKNRIKGRIYRYVKKYMALMETGQMPVPSSDDCWACLQETQMIPPNGLWYTSRYANFKMPSGHLEDHIKQKQFVPSMMVNALVQSNWSTTHINKWLVNELGRMKRPLGYQHPHLSYYLGRWLRSRILG